MTMKSFRKNLQNPFALVFQGFIAGSILFWATAPSESSAQTPAPAAQQAQR